MKKVNFESFNALFFKEAEGASDISWYNKTGIYPLSERKNAEITISSPKIVGEYTGYNVRIVHKDNGVIAQNTFAFDSYMAGRKGDTCYDGLHITEHCCEDTGEARWYRDRPSQSDTKSMANTIMHYIKQWK